MNNRFILVRPTGGLADMFSQIGRCIAYGEKYNREVVVDTDLKSFFGAHLSRHFSISHDCTNVKYFYPKFYDVFNSLSCFPPQMQGRLSSYTAEQIPADLREKQSEDIGHFVNFRCSDFKIPLSFDMRIDYEQEILLHHCSGSDLDSAVIAMNCLVPTQRIERSLKTSFQKIGPIYDAIHIRDTDLKADYNSVLTLNIDWDKSTPLVVFSDNRNAVKKIKKLSPSSLRIISSPNSYGVSKLYSLYLGGKTKHKGARLFKSTLNEAALIDLFLISLAEESYPLPLQDGQIKTVSGFWGLANALKEKNCLFYKRLKDIVESANE